MAKPKPKTFTRDEVEKFARTLRELPQHQKQTFTIAEMIEALAGELQVLRDEKGYDLEATVTELAKITGQKTSTLRTYVRAVLAKRIAEQRPRPRPQAKPKQATTQNTAGERGTAAKTPSLGAHAAPADNAPKASATTIPTEANPLSAPAPHPAQPTEPITGAATSPSRAPNRTEKAAPDRGSFEPSHDTKHL